MSYNEHSIGGAAELVRIMSLYGVLEYRQLLELRPEKNESTRNQISWLVKNGRLFREDPYVKARSDMVPELATITAFWVLTDFFRTGRIEYHTKSDFPATIYFFVGNESYDIIVVPPGSESLICHALQYGAHDTDKHIVVVDNAEQLQQLQACPLPGEHIFCMVSESGRVNYFKRI